jgi:hypothetical protein
MSERLAHRVGSARMTIPWLSSRRAAIIEILD